jgi:hypothetical protein
VCDMSIRLSEDLISEPTEIFRPFHNDQLVAVSSHVRNASLEITVYLNENRSTEDRARSRIARLLGLCDSDRFNGSVAGSYAFQSASFSALSAFHRG